MYVLQKMNKEKNSSTRKDHPIALKKLIEITLKNVYLVLKKL